MWSDYDNRKTVVQHTTPRANARQVLGLEPEQKPRRGYVVRPTTCSCKRASGMPGWKTIDDKCPVHSLFIVSGGEAK